jgi:hypothetical protein
MHSWELAELAAHLASRRDLLGQAAHPVSPTALSQFWSASKCRHDRWARTLRHNDATSSGGDQNGSIAQRRYRSVCQEILTSEILSRVWANVCSALDAANGNGEAEPVAQSVLGGHLEATNRVLGLISAESNPADCLPSELNRLRRQSQRWTDLLLGRFGWPAGIARYAHDADRASDFADDFSQPRRQCDGQASWMMLLASLRSTFRRDDHWVTPNADLNARIAGAILSCLPEEIFSHTDGFDWLWRLRLTTAANETSMLVDQLLEIGVPVETAQLR